jgi:hypothetical protein
LRLLQQVIEQRRAGTSPRQRHGLQLQPVNGPAGEHKPQHGTKRQNEHGNPGQDAELDVRRQRATQVGQHLERVH